MTNIFSYNQICAKKDENKELSKLIDDYHAIIKEHYHNNFTITNQNVSLFHAFIERKKTEGIKREIDLCQGKMCGWEQRAFLFLFTPNVKYSPRPIKDIASMTQLQNHIVNHITMLRNDMFIGHDTLYNNWNVYKNKIDTVINFTIAIGSFILAFIGLILSIISFYY